MSTPTLIPNAIFFIDISTIHFKTLSGYAFNIHMFHTIQQAF